MKIIDENGRLFGKISVIDVVVLLLVVAMAAAIFFVKRDQAVTGNSVAEQPITFQVLVSGAYDYMEPMIQVGDLLYD